MTYCDLRIIFVTAEHIALLKSMVGGTGSVNCFTLLLKGQHKTRTNIFKLNVFVVPMFVDHIII